MGIAFTAIEGGAPRSLALRIRCSGTGFRDQALDKEELA
jgi:hypothetical protein